MSETLRTTHSSPKTTQSGIPACTVCGGRLKPWFPFTYGAKTYRLHQCADCGMALRLPFPAQGELEGFYGETYYILDHARAEKYLDEAVGDYWQKIRRFEKGQGGRLLEIGCSRGFLLAACRARGWDVQGVEISDAACAVARDVTRVPVFCGVLGQFLASNGDRRFDLIVALDVLEHIEDTVAFLSGCRSLLAPGGTHLVEFPNIESAWRRALGPHWVGFNPFHIAFPTRKALARAADRAGLVLREFSTTHNDLFSRRNLWRWTAHPAAQGLIGKLRPSVESGGVSPAREWKFDPEKLADRMRTPAPPQTENPLARRLGLGDQSVAVLTMP